MSPNLLKEFLEEGAGEKKVPREGEVWLVIATADRGDESVVAIYHEHSFAKLFLKIFEGELSSLGYCNESEEGEEALWYTNPATFQRVKVWCKKLKADEVIQGFYTGELVAK